MSVELRAYFARPSEAAKIETQRLHCNLRAICHEYQKDCVYPISMAKAIIEFERHSDSYFLSLIAHVPMMLATVCDWNSRQRRLMWIKANRRKGELRAPSPFPPGGYSALPRTGGIPQPLEARPYGQTMPAHLRVRHLDLAARRQQAHRLSVPKNGWISTVGVILFIPIRLSSYPEREHEHLKWASDGFIQRVSTPCLFHAKLEKFFIWPLFEFLPTSKELFVCRRKPMITILSCSELESTNVVGNLREPVFRSRCGSVYDCTHKENKVYRFMQVICNGALSAIVINLDFVKCLKTAEIVKEELYEPFSHSTRHVVFRFKLFHSEFKQLIANRQMSHEYSKCIQQSASGFECEPLILAMPGHEGRCMERDVRHISSYQTLLIKADRFSDARILVVEYQSKQVIGLSQVIAAGFIDKDTQLCHINHSKKKAGENVPGTWRPLRKENHFFYTTRRLDYSIIAKYEHVFSIQKGGIA
jgi:hypothetical protein